MTLFHDLRASSAEETGRTGGLISGSGRAIVTSITLNRPLTVHGTVLAWLTKLRDLGSFFGTVEASWAGDATSGRLEAVSVENRAGGVRTLDWIEGADGARNLNVAVLGAVIARWALMVLVVDDSSLVTRCSLGTIFTIFFLLSLLSSVVGTLLALLGLVLTRWAIVSCRANVQLGCRNSNDTVVASNTVDTIVGSLSSRERILSFLTRRGNLGSRNAEETTGA